MIVRRGFCALIAALVLAVVPVIAQATAGFEATTLHGVALRQRGEVEASIAALTTALALATTDRERMRASGELGASLTQARQLESAYAQSLLAYGLASGADRAPYALDLGNVSVLRKRKDDAKRYYEEAQRLSDHALVRISAALNLQRIAPQVGTLETLYAEIGHCDDLGTQRARLYLNLGHQAQASGQMALAYRSLEQARSLSQDNPPERVHLEALDALAQLYQAQGRKADALVLVHRALGYAAQLPQSAVGDLLIALEARQGQLYTALGQSDLALAAYQRAAEHIEALRLDIPIEYEDGSSSFLQTFEPLYLSLVDALLTAAQGASADQSTHYLRRAIGVVELLKQAEMQDYLGDRCTVDDVKGAAATVIPVGSAVVYPLVFSDRIELLVQTRSGIARYSSRVAGMQMRSVALSLARSLRNGDPNFLDQAQQLYNWVLRPLQPFLIANTIGTLVLVPDAALRLVPWGALHDGHRFAIETYAFTTITGLSMTNTTPASATNATALVAGASRFGSVVDKLLQTGRGQRIAATLAQQVPSRGLAQSRMLRAPLRLAVNSATQATNPVLALRDALVLPGVAQEIQSVSRILHGKRMQDDGFTVGQFRDAVESGKFRILHVASHGVFGGSADASYVMAFDDFLTLDGLQTLLKEDQFRKNPLELLTLSACETAEGDERAPLGISGAAIKARAKSVLGTLWPVDDEAAVKVMETFYGGLTQAHLSKSQALRQAQIRLIQNPEMAHPFFWAAFILIGNWL